MNSKLKLLLLLGLGISTLNTTAYAKTDACDLKSLEGGYGFTLTGSNLKLNVPYVIVGRFVSDGAGGLSGTATQSVGGKIFVNTFTATYSVSEACTGSATLEFNGGAKAELDFVIVSSGQEVMMVVKDPGTVESGTAKKELSERHK